MGVRDLAAKHTARMLASPLGFAESATFYPRGVATGYSMRVSLGEAVPSASDQSGVLQQSRVVPLYASRASVRSIATTAEGAARDLEHGDVIDTTEGRMVVESCVLDGVGYLVAQCVNAGAIAAAGGRG